jgi:hypothetical protein
MLSLTLASYQLPGERTTREEPLIDYWNRKLLAAGDGGYASTPSRASVGRILNFGDWLRNSTGLS